jgi:Rrf2 family protein
MAPLRRSAVQALQALLQLAQEQQQWLSVNSVAAAQGLPAPMLEQLLLELRRAGLVEARRGRQGGYRLARPAGAIRVAEVFEAVGAPLELLEPEHPSPRAEQLVLRSLSKRLQQALDRELQGLSLQELVFDLRSWQESLSNDGGVMLG